MYANEMYDDFSFIDKCLIVNLIIVIKIIMISMLNFFVGDISELHVAKCE